MKNNTLKKAIIRVMSVFITLIIIFPTLNIERVSAASFNVGTFAGLQAALSDSATDIDITITDSFIMESSVSINSNKKVSISSAPGYKFTLTATTATVFSVQNDGLLTMSNIEIDGDRDNIPGIQATSLILVRLGGTFVMNEGTVLKNARYLTKNGYGVQVGETTGSTNPATFIMNGGVITNCTSGIYMIDSVFTMNNGEISYNSIGINCRINNPSYYTIYDGSISYNDNIGIYCVVSRLTMYGGIVSNNGHTGTGTNRTGIYVSSGGNISLYGGEITNNFSHSNGGGISSSTGSSTIHISGDTKIINNEAVGNGGGIFLYSGIITISGNPTISGNQAGGSGGGIYISPGSPFGGIELLTDAKVSFSNNKASSLVTPPDISPIPSTRWLGEVITISRDWTGDKNLLVFNNYDINYRGPEITLYNIEYFPNGGTGIGLIEVDKEENETFVAANNPFTAPEKRCFKEWNTEADGSGIGYAEGDLITVGAEDIKLYAQWERFRKQFEYNANGGIGSYSEILVYEDDLVVVENPVNIGISKLNCSFLNWNTEADGSGVTYYPGDIILADNDYTLYAQWLINTQPQTGDTNFLLPPISVMGICMIIMILILKKEKSFRK